MLSAALDSLRIIDAVPEFWSFWEVAAWRDRDEQAALFRRMVADRCPDLYYDAAVLTGRRDMSFEPVLTDKLRDFLADARPLMCHQRLRDQ